MKSPTSHTAFEDSRSLAASTGERNEVSATPIRVVIAYDEVPAGRRAMGLLTRMLESDAEHFHLIPAVWRFDLLEDAEWRESALADAVAADLLILSASKPRDISTTVESWVAAFLSRRRGTSTAILVLVGKEDEWSISIQEAAAIPLAVPNLSVSEADRAQVHSRPRPQAA